MPSSETIAMFFYLSFLLSLISFFFFYDSSVLVNSSSRYHLRFGQTPDSDVAVFVTARVRRRAFRRRADGTDDEKMKYVPFAPGYVDALLLALSKLLFCGSKHVYDLICFEIL